MSIASELREILIHDAQHEQAVMLELPDQNEPWEYYPINEELSDEGEQ